MKIHEHQAQIKFDDILEHRLSVIFDFTQGIVSSFSDGYMQTMYQAVSEACEKSGNIVRSNEIGSPALSFLQALKNIQFGVDRAGKISRPEFHLGTDAFKKLEEDAERLGNKFKEEVERVTKEKEEEALAREAERLSRFKGS
ncbi:MAG TPA: hypothetical protein DEB21_06075 [Rhodospirillaceae bacterium]|nr:hypothetical protein [Rhodospirillaceae bacterium]